MVIECRKKLFLQNVLADAWVVPLSELGRSEQQFHTRTHLGHLLHDGDTAWGFHFTRANVNNPNMDKMKPVDIPDVVSNEISLHPTCRLPYHVHVLGNQQTFQMWFVGYKTSPS